MIDWPNESALISVRDLHKSFGGVKAVNGISFDVVAGGITGLIGPNGAGKSTVVNIISGFHRSDSGSVTLGSTEITNWAPHRVAQVGLIRTFQVARELQRLTVLENMMLSPGMQLGENPVNAILRRNEIRREEERHLERALELLDRFQLLHQRDEYAGNLSGGQKKLLELARALMAEPKVVLLDEPMAGINPALARTLQEGIAELAEQGMTFLIIEHNLEVVESICNHVVVMAEGKLLAQGTMAVLRENEQVIAAYLGA